MSFPPDLVAFRALVDHYHALVREVVGRIEAQYGISHIEDVWDDRLPWAGELPGLSFHHHGLGFTATLNNYTVKWDWWADRNMDHFDPWALAQLAEGHEAEFGIWHEPEVLRAYVLHLEQTGIVEQVNVGGAYRFTDTP
ncbi:DUF6896 domain-containing protein [Deinococcus aquiradiocola]|uniref:DUF6896 domain-containing protein n=1 Tax=Deinococcus aquiradiocola TaxID=393059 RepID=A0A917PPT2_9DEIO|nr:hypothetical protein [Deinococcus aquiradiocola]GGJ87170.1 hypothetical protein GCM10008939_33970 [Deinococcus aquiradiocola]